MGRLSIFNCSKWTRNFAGVDCGKVINALEESPDELERLTQTDGYLYVLRAETSMHHPQDFHYKGKPWGT